MKKSKNGKRDLRLRIRAEKKLLKKFAATRQLHHKHVTVHQLLQKKNENKANWDVVWRCREVPKRGVGWDVEKNLPRTRTFASSTCCLPPAISEPPPLCTK